MQAGGGVGPDQVNLVVSDLIGVQQMLSAAFPQVNNLTDLHAQVIINQLNEEIASIENASAPAGTLILGTDLGQFVGRAINDIHRDIIDIAQGDPGLQAAFNPTPLPALNTPPAPFHDNASRGLQIESTMTTAQLAEAKDRAEAWRPNSLDEVLAMTIPLPEVAGAKLPWPRLVLRAYVANAREEGIGVRVLDVPAPHNKKP